MSNVAIASALPGELVIEQFDFTSQLAVGVTISTKVVLATVYSGTDVSPQDIVSGTATNAGAVVSQKVDASKAVIGVLYTLLCTVTTSDGQTLQKANAFCVIPAAAA